MMKFGLPTPWNSHEEKYYPDSNLHQKAVRPRNHREARKKTEQWKKPHPSYDLDNDGFVSQRDYFLAKTFDKDGDGVLNRQERANAEAHLRGGLTDIDYNTISQGNVTGPSSSQVFTKNFKSSFSNVIDDFDRTRAHRGVVQRSSAGAGGSSGGSDARKFVLQNSVLSPREALLHKRKEEFRSNAWKLSQRVENKIQNEHQSFQHTLRRNYKSGISANGTSNTRSNTRSTNSGRNSGRRNLSMNRPSMTYDLNGDGVVDSTEYWVSSIHDHDHNQTLDKSERQEAKDHMAEVQNRQKPHQAYTVNLGSKPGQTHFGRILQKSTTSQKLTHGLKNSFNRVIGGAYHTGPGVQHSADRRQKKRFAVGGLPTEDYDFNYKYEEKSTINDTNTNTNTNQKNHPHSSQHSNGGSSTSRSMNRNNNDIRHSRGVSAANGRPFINNGSNDRASADSRARQSNRSNNNINNSCDHINDWKFTTKTRSKQSRNNFNNTFNISTRGVLSTSPWATTSSMVGSSHRSNIAQSRGIHTDYNRDIGRSNNSNQSLHSTSQNSDQYHHHHNNINNNNNNNNKSMMNNPSNNNNATPSSSSFAALKKSAVGRRDGNMSSFRNGNCLIDPIVPKSRYERSSHVASTNYRNHRR